MEDRNFAIVVALLVLSRPERREELTAAVRELDPDPEEHYGEPSEVLLDWLVGYPLDEADLASVRVLCPPAMDVINDVFPGFDGETDPFPIRELADLERLPAIEEVWCNQDAEVDVDPILAATSVQRVHVSTPEPRQKRHAKAIARLEEAGFAVVATTGKFGWITLERGARGASLAVISALHRCFPIDRVRRDRGGGRLRVQRLAIEDGALVATVTTEVCDRSGAILREHERPVRLLERADLDADDVLDRLEARVAALAEEASS